MVPQAGAFDDVKATFYAPVRTTLGSGEQEVTYSNTPTFSRYIRILKNIAREGVTVLQVISATQATIEMRRDSTSLTMKPDWRMIHRGITYGIVGINPTHGAEDLVRFTVDSVIK